MASPSGCLVFPVLGYSALITGSISSIVLLGVADAGYLLTAIDLSRNGRERDPIIFKNSYFL